MSDDREDDVEIERSTVKLERFHKQVGDLQYDGYGSH